MKKVFNSTNLTCLSLFFVLVGTCLSFASTWSAHRAEALRQNQIQAANASFSRQITILQRRVQKDEHDLKVVIPQLQADLAREEKENAKLRNKLAALQHTMTLR